MTAAENRQAARWVLGRRRWALWWWWRRGGAEEAAAVGATGADEDLVCDTRLLQPRDLRA